MASRTVVVLALCVLLFGEAVHGHKPCTVYKTANGTHMDCCCRSLTSFPDDVTGDVDWLDISHNDIEDFPESLSEVLPMLRHLNASHNRLREVGSTTFAGLMSLESLKLAYNRIKVIDSNAFRDASNLKEIQLDNNELTAINATTFRGLANLERLDLSKNVLTELPEGAFSDLGGLQWLSVADNLVERLTAGSLAGLTQLQSLSLARNEMEYDNSSLPPGVFASLRSLQTLDMVGNGDDLDGGYPSGVFGDLTSLSSLKIDSFRRLHFGPDFAKLRSLTTLDLSERCRVSMLTNDSFQGLRDSPLTRLSLTYCKGLLRVETCVFCLLPSLRYLYLDENKRLRLPTALRSLYGLARQPMEEVKLRRVGRIVHDLNILDRDSARHLRSLCVRRLDLSSTGLQSVKHHGLYDYRDPASNRLAACVQHLDLSENYIIGDVMGLWEALANFKKLVTIRGDRQFTHSLDQFQCLFSQRLDCKNRLSTPGNIPVTVLQFPIPPSLTSLNLSSAVAVFNLPSPVINFTSADSLLTLDVSYGVLSNCLTTSLGLGRLRSLNLSGNFCHNISVGSFDHLPSLRELSLSTSRLSQEVMQSGAHRLFRGLASLETLDLASNGLQRIQDNALPNLVSLRRISLAGNLFRAIPLDLDLHPDLTDLDLSFNSLTTLTPSERQALDKAATRPVAAREGFRLQLRGNLLSCTCTNLQFTSWLWSTRVLLDGGGPHRRRYACTTETGKLSDTERQMSEMEAHWRRCVGQQAFGVALAIFFLQMLGLLATYLLARSWTHVLYTWHVIRRRLRLPRREDYRRDVYVAYATVDTELACLKLDRCLRRHGVTTLLPSAEFVAGSVLAETIVKHMDDCWKILLVVSPAFAADEWLCGFTVLQAQRSISDLRPDRVVVLFLAPPRALPPMASLHALLATYPERNVVHAHPALPDTHPVWARLAATILDQNH